MNWIIKLLHRFFHKEKSKNKYDDFLYKLNNINIDISVIYKINKEIEVPYSNIMIYLNMLISINNTDWGKNYLDTSLLVRDIKTVKFKRWFIDNDNRIIDIYILNDFIKEINVLINKYYDNIKDKNIIPNYSNAKKMDIHIGYLYNIMNTIYKEIENGGVKNI